MLVFIQGAWLFFMIVGTVTFTASSFTWGFILGIGPVPAGLPACVFMDGGNQHCDYDDSEDWLRELLLYNREAPNHPCTSIHELEDTNQCGTCTSRHMDIYYLYQTICKGVS